MLTIFPQLLDYAFPATAVLRFVIGIIFIIEGKRNFQKSAVSSAPVPQKKVAIRKAHAIIEVVGGSLVFIGLFTQIVCIVLSLSLLVRMYAEYKTKQEDKRVCSFYVLLFFTTVSLLFFGPGMLALDYPL